MLRITVKTARAHRTHRYKQVIQRRPMGALFQIKIKKKTPELS